MAKPKKLGLDYFPFDVDFFQDRKIKGLRGRYGETAVCIYQYLLCEVYRDKGYYLVFDDDLLDDLIDTFNKTEDFIQQVINYLCSRSLIDNTLFTSVKVITSHSIQKRYQMAKNQKGYKENTVDVEGAYWILSVDETLDCINVTQKHNNSEKNKDISEKKDSNFEKKTTKESKEKKIKEKQSKVNETLINRFGDVRQKLHEKFVSTTYSAWFSDLELVSIDGILVELCVREKYSALVIEENYLSAINEIINEVYGGNYEVKILWRHE